jgi:hypothetical protein
MFFGVSFGASMSFLSVLFSTSITDHKVFATFVALSVLFSLGSILFGVYGWRDYKRAQSKMLEFKQAYNERHGAEG